MNQQHKLSLSTLSLIILTAGSLFALNTPTENLSVSDMDLYERGRVILKLAMEQIWANSSEREANESLLKQAETIFHGISDEAARTYALAQVEIYRGRLEILQKDKKTAQEHAEKAMEHARISIEARESADAYRLRAEAGSLWMGVHGLAGMLKMAPQVQLWLDEALALNPQNAMAIVLNNQRKIFAPKVSGGAPEEAVLQLSAQLPRQDLTKIERFWILTSLSQAHKKLRQKSQAAQYCDEAALIFPNSLLIKRCR
ncbi:MAG: hypothetical protein B0D92_02850 [Spirochaeta sp. LUC14_002_19_P3]|nr:MAG: hypothetical protein B0D92_02850 [Spirochaeta sp. LUC14_002_19_P3]